MEVAVTGLVAATGLLKTREKINNVNFYVLAQVKPENRRHTSIFVTVKVHTKTRFKLRICHVLNQVQMNLNKDFTLFY